MTLTRLKRDLRSVAFTTPTPFSPDGEAVDHTALESNIKYLDNNGAKTVIPCGNTGEYYSLSQQERTDVVRTTADAFDGTVIGGVAGSTKTVLTLADKYEQAGADAIMVMNPDHTYVHDQGLLDYYRTIASGVDIGVVLYKRGDTVSDETLLRMAEHENVVGVKYAVNDIKSFSEVTNRSNADVVWTNGIAERFAPAYGMEGAEGFTTGIGNFLPNEVLMLHKAIERGDWSRAREIRDVLQPLEALREESGEGNRLSAANNVPVVKHGMDLHDLTGGPVREPLVTLSAHDQERLEHICDEIHNRAIVPS